MELHQLQAFITVARTGSLTRAAEGLHVTQPAISAHLKALEAELGVSLFHRRPRGVELTEAGAKLLDYADEAVAQTRQLKAAADRLAAGLDQGVSLGIIHSGVDLRIATISGRLKSQEPGLRLQLVSGNSGHHLAALLEHRLDAAIVEGEVGYRGLARHELATSTVGVIGPKAWEAELRDADWDVLARRPWVFQSDQCSYSQLTHRVCEEHGLTLNAEYHTEQFAAVYDLVTSGLALSIADRSDAQPLAEQGRLFIWPAFSADLPVRLVYLRKREAEPAIAALIGAVCAAHEVVLATG